MKKKPYKNSVENKEQICLALAEIMEKTSFNKITVTNVCKKAGISKNTFYRHFKNLSDVIYYSIGEINNRLVTKIYALENHRVDDFIALTCDIWYENRKIYKGFTQDEVIYIIRNFIKKDIREFYKKYGLADDELFYEFFSTVFSMFLRWWSEKNFEASPEKVSALIKSYLCGNALESLQKFI